MELCDKSFSNSEKIIIIIMTKNKIIDMGPSPKSQVSQPCSELGCKSLHDKRSLSKAKREHIIMIIVLFETKGSNMFSLRGQGDVVKSVLKIDGSEEAVFRWRVVVKKKFMEEKV